MQRINHSPVVYDLFPRFTDKFCNYQISEGKIRENLLEDVRVEAEILAILWHCR